MKIGVLALQGAFAEHVAVLRCDRRGGRRGAPARAPRGRRRADPARAARARRMRRLIDRWGLREPILDLAARGAPLFGTCAGMIVLSRDIAGRRGAGPAAARRDRGAQRVRAPARLVRDGAGRAAAGRHAGPRRVHPGAGHRARRARTSTCWRRSTTGAWSPSASGTSSRPRSTRSSPGETRFHRLVATMAAEHADPGEGTGRRPHPTRRSRRRRSHGAGAPARSGRPV